MALTYLQFSDYPPTFIVSSIFLSAASFLAWTFVAGGSATVVSEVGGNLIVNVKETRIAIGKEMAMKVMI